MQTIRKKRRMDRYGNTWKTNVFLLSLLLIPLLNFLVFTVYANLGGIFLSFRQFDYNIKKEVFVSFQNYERFFRDFYTKQYDKSVWISLAYLPVVGGISLPISVITAFFLYKKIPFSKLIVILLYIPNIIPAAVMAEFYRRMWDAGGGVVQTGFLTQLFSFVSGREINWLVSPQYANWAIWIYTVWFGFGFNALLIWGAMSRVPQEMVEAAQLDGAGLFVEFTKVTVPIIWSTLSMVIVLTVTVPFQVYMQPLLLAANGDHGTRTIALLAIQETKRPDPYFAATINILIACISIPTVLIVKKLTDKAFETVEI